jgi:hypothetical protein
MGFWDWVWHNWFTFLQSIGIVGGLVFTGVSLRIDAKVRQVGNLLTVTQHHREIWSNLYQRPELSRVLDPGADIEGQPVSTAEELLVLMVILHLSGVYEARKDGMLVSLEGLQKDVQEFFNLPLPGAVWTKFKGMQNVDFVRFVEAARSGKPRGRVAR